MFRENNISAIRGTPVSHAPHANKNISTSFPILHLLRLHSTYQNSHYNNFITYNKLIYLKNTYNSWDPKLNVCNVILQR